MLSVEGLQAAAGSFRVGPVSFAVEAGECHALLGPSGAGKSTLLGAVLGVTPALAGTVRLAGEDVTRWPIERRRIGYLPQRLGLFPHLTVLENLRYGPRVQRLPEADTARRLRRLVEVAALGPLLDRRPDSLSGGERQRVALVRALAAAPRLVLLDEPFSTLDDALRRELGSLVLELQRESELAVLLVTHDLAEAHLLATRFTVLLGGRQAQSDTREAVLRHPATAQVARLVGVRNLLDGTVADAGHVECPALGGGWELPCPPSLERGAACRVGVRSSRVQVRQAPEESTPVGNALAASVTERRLLPGTVTERRDLGDFVELRVRLDTGASLEAHLSVQDPDLGALVPGARAVLRVERESLFVVPPERLGTEDTTTRRA